MAKDTGIPEQHPATTELENTIASHVHVRGYHVAQHTPGTGIIVCRSGPRRWKIEVSLLEELQ